MKKPINFLGISWGTRQTVVITVLLLIVIIAGLLWPQDLMAIILAAAALIVAFFSLEWATTTMRPYVSRSDDIQINQSPGYLTIEFQLLNSGRIPASDVSIETDLFGINEEVTEDNASKKYPGANDVAPRIAVLFPNNKYYLNYTINLNEKLGRKLRDDILAGQVVFRLRIKYRSHGREHLTIQTEQLDPTQGMPHPAIRPVGLQKWT